MYRFLFYAFLFGVVLCWLPVSNAAILPLPSPHTVADKPVKFTAYHSYLASDGTVTLRRYIKQPTIHHKNPFVGKKIVSIKKHGASEEQNAAMARVARECGSLDAVFLIEAESGWRLDVTGVSGDKGLWQWAPKWNAPIIRDSAFKTWDYQIKVGCAKFRSLADVNEVRYSSRWKDWRTKEGAYWHGMANAYNPGVLKRFEIVTESK
jgi:hypothetical protein